MTRRQFLFSSAAAAGRGLRREPVVVPLHQVLDADAKWDPGEVDRFWRSLWPASARQLGGCGIRFATSYTAGRVQRPPGREPVVTGLELGQLNLVITNRIPMQWDSGRTLSGVSMRYRGYDLCMVAMDHAHGLQIPLVSVNTCTHELLHALMLDIFQARPGGAEGQWREFRIDWYATQLCMGIGSDTIRESARRYVQQLQHNSEPRPGGSGGPALSPEDASTRLASFPPLRSGLGSEPRA